jgi:hypothetical protein
MMTAQSRQTKVLVALLVSIAVGTLILNALGYNPPSAGAFCLSRYYRLAPVEKAVICDAAQYRGRWRRIEIYCSGGSSEEQTRGGAYERVGPLDPLSSVCDSEGLNCHFVIFNGRTGEDGEIQPTEKWKRQCSVNHQSRSDRQPALADALTIFICIVTDGKIDRPTDFQMKRSEALVEELCRRFNVWPESILYPDVWR